MRDAARAVLLAVGPELYVKSGGSLVQASTATPGDAVARG